MLRNHITKSDLIKRINLSDPKIIAFQSSMRLLYFAIVRKFILETGTDYAASGKFDNFISDILAAVLNSEKQLLPKEIETFFTGGKIDFDSLSLEIYNKCINCGKMSSIDAGKKQVAEGFEVSEKTHYFCVSCLSVSVRTPAPLLKSNNKIQEPSEEILFHGNSVLAAIYEAVKDYNLEQAYLEHIIKYSELVINHIFKDDDKAARYFYKLVEELSEDCLVYQLIFLHPNFRYSYPIHYTYC